MSNNTGVHFLSCFNRGAHMYRVGNGPITRASVQRAVTKLPGNCCGLCMRTIVGRAIRRNTLSKTIVDCGNARLSLIASSVAVISTATRRTRPRAFIVRDFMATSSMRLTLDMRTGTGFACLTVSGVIVRCLNGCVRLNSIGGSFGRAVGSIMVAIGTMLRGPSVGFGRCTTSIGNSSTVTVNSMIGVLRVMLASNVSMTDCTHAHDRLTMRSSRLTVSTASTVLTVGTSYVIPMTLDGNRTCSTFRISLRLPRNMRLISITLDSHTADARAVL